MISQKAVKVVEEALSPFIGLGVIKKSEVSDILLLINNRSRMTNKHDQYLSRKETAEKLGVSLSTLDRIANRGELIPRTIGLRRKVYSLRTVDDLIKGENR